jgi:hypothetical protein
MVRIRRRPLVRSLWADSRLRSGGVSEALKAPVPRQELVDAPCGMIRQAGQHVGEPSLRIDVVELGGGDEGVDRRRTPAAVIGRGLIVPGVRRSNSRSDIRFTHSPGGVF